jgi:hypothetical protein
MVDWISLELCEGSGKSKGLDSNGGQPLRPSKKGMPRPDHTGPVRAVGNGAGSPATFLGLQRWLETYPTTKSGPPASRRSGGTLGVSGCDVIEEEADQYVVFARAELQSSRPPQRRGASSTVKKVS